MWANFVNGKGRMQIAMTRKQQRIRTLFAAPTKQPVRHFPAPGDTLVAPSAPGVYVICDPRGNVVHVGATPRGKRGLAQRLKNHMHGASSFTQRHLEGQGSRLRRGYSYRYLVVRKPETRAYLEAYTIGSLCPAHIGVTVAEQTR